MNCKINQQKWLNLKTKIKVDTIGRPTNATKIENQNEILWQKTLVVVVGERVVRNSLSYFFFYVVPYCEETSFWPPSMVYISVISYILHITNHAGPSVWAAIHVVHLWTLPLLGYGYSSWSNSCLLWSWVSYKRGFCNCLLANIKACIINPMVCHSTIWIVT